MPTSVDAPITPRSASSRVFALPELLEIILVHVSTFSRPSYKRRGPNYVNPATDLFVLQRVNRSFQDIIVRNSTIRRRMFLEARPGGGQDKTIRHALDWLVKTVGVFKDDHEMHVNGHTLGLHLRFKEQPFCKTHEASWRNMKIHCAQASVETGISFRTRWTHVPLHIIEANRVDGMTLGQLHDGLVSLIPLFIEHEEAAAATMKDVFEPRASSDDRIRALLRKKDALKRILTECARADMWT